MDSAAPTSPEPCPACGVRERDRQPATSERDKRESSYEGSQEGPAPLRHQHNLPTTYYSFSKREKHGKSYGGGAPEKEDVVASVVIRRPDRLT
jgi:hypothetical protein